MVEFTKSPYVDPVTWNTRAAKGIAATEIAKLEIAAINARSDEENMALLANDWRALSLSTDEDLAKKVDFRKAGLMTRAEMAKRALKANLNPAEWADREYWLGVIEAQRGKQERLAAILALRKKSAKAKSKKSAKAAPAPKNPSPGRKITEERYQQVADKIREALDENVFLSVPQLMTSEKMSEGPVSVALKHLPDSYYRLWRKLSCIIGHVRKAIRRGGTRSTIASLAKNSELSEETVYQVLFRSLSEREWSTWCEFQDRLNTPKPERKVGYHRYPDEMLSLLLLRVSREIKRGRVSSLRTLEIDFEPMHQHDILDFLSDHLEPEEFAERNRLATSGPKDPEDLEQIIEEMTTQAVAELAGSGYITSCKMYAKKYHLCPQRISQILKDKFGEAWFKNWDTERRSRIGRMPEFTFQSQFNLVTSNMSKIVDNSALTPDQRIGMAQVLMNFANELLAGAR